MFFSVDLSNGVPIYEQIACQVKYAVAARTLRPGQLLPSVRVLATQLAVNPNTVARAFGDLQSDGVVKSLRGRGMVVCRGAAAVCRRQRREIVADRIESVLTEALQAGLSAEEVSKVVQRKLGSLAKSIHPLESSESSDE